MKKILWVTWICLICLPDLWSKPPLPLPRFAVLRADKVNWRVGPGEEYPIDWTYQKAGLPVKIIAESDTWRQIEDMDGTRGWVHQSMLSGKRNVYIKKNCNLTDSPSQRGRVVARVKPKVLGKILECQESYCKIQVGDRKGWVDMDNFWGLTEDEQAGNLPKKF